MGWFDGIAEKFTREKRENNFNEEEVKLIDSQNLNAKMAYAGFQNNAALTKLYQKEHEMLIGNQKTFALKFDELEKRIEELENGVHP